MSEELSQAMAAAIVMQHEHLQDMAQLQRQQPSNTMRMNRKELLEKFGELQIQVSDSTEEVPCSDQSLRIAYLGATYPPCALPLAKLQPISLPEMSLETHHRGRFIGLKTISEPLQIGTALIAVEDGVGNVCVVALFHRRIAAEILRKNILLALKEPYLTLTPDGTILIRVDHPSDLIRLDMDSRFLPVSMTTVPIPLFSPTERQRMGDAAVLCGDLQGAIGHYNRGLGIKQYDEEVRCTLHLSRAQTCFDLGRYEHAVLDAVAAMAIRNQSGDTNAQSLKALLLAGRAAYEMGEYTFAKEYFTRGLVISPGADDALAHIRRIQNRLKEESTGAFDFDAMLKSDTKNFDDHASFVMSTKIASAGHRGRGLFAVKRLAPGELVLAEKAFYIVSDNDTSIEEAPVVVNLSGSSPQCYRGRFAKRIYGATEKILHNPKQAAKFLDLHDGGSFNKVTNWVDSMVIVDTFRVEAITRLNAFAVPASSATCAESDATGIWVHASHANHSCLPNADRSFIGNMMIMRANRDIDIGEEIFLSYCEQDDTYPQRQNHLSSYGFQCDCPLCVAEESIPAILNKRAALVGESKNFITTNVASADLSNLPGTTISAAEELLRQLEGTYPDERYHHLPRLECVPLSYWLCLVHGTPEEQVARALNALRNHGYFVNLSNGVTIDRSTAVPLGPAMIISLIATAASLKLGNAELALELQKLRKETYIILHGCESGLEEMERRFGA